MKEYFLSCDWGTSSFRLRLVRIQDLHILQEENSSQGIAATFNEWEQQPIKSDEARQAFYLNIIAAHITKLEEATNIPLKGIPVVLSGMASSTIGILNIPYQQLPFAVDGRDLNTHWIDASIAFDHDVLIISGVSSDDDVIRGEETQLIGCLGADQTTDEAALFIFPGTHSKHITVKNKQAIAFATYMTGEFFALLSTKSILSGAVKANHDEDLTSFKKGVTDAAKNNLLHAAFLTRTNDLFGKYSKEENYNYLSGLLIGTELKELVNIQSAMYLCCGSNLMPYYHAALEVLGLEERIKAHPSEWIDKAVIRGQLKIFTTKSGIRYEQSI